MTIDDDFFSLDKKISPVDPTRLGDESIKINRWDREDFKRLMEDLPNFRKEEEHLEEIADNPKALWSDTFHAIKKSSPQRVSDDELKPSHRINAHVVDQLRSLADYDRLRSLGAMGDELGSAMATMSMRPDIQRLYERLQEEREMAKELEALGAQIADIGDSDEMQDALDALQEQYDQQSDALNDALKGKQSMMRQALRDGTRKAIQEAEDGQSAMGLAGIDPGELKRMPAQTRMDLAKRLQNPKLKKIAEKFGAMKRLAFGEQRRHFEEAQDEYGEIELGNDLDKVLASEMLNLGDPDLELDFMRRYVENNLSIYRITGEEYVGAGGIIVLLDSSGSMNGPREIWAKAVTLCLLSIARSQKRTFRAVNFSSASEQEIFEFLTPADYTTERILDLAEHAYGGGTAYEKPLNLARDWMHEEFLSTGKSSQDCVLITDGECNLQSGYVETYRDDMAKMMAKVWGICILAPSREGDVMHTICDQVMNVQDLTTGSEVRAVFGGINGAVRTNPQPN